MVATIKFIFITILFWVCYISETKGQSASRPVSDLCLGCICAAISNCESRVCKGHLCGIFTISRPFWIDAGKPTLEGKSPYDDDAYQTCSNNDYCAIDTVQGYMSKFKQDCNGDGRVTCYDYLAIHQLGGFDCKGANRIGENRLSIFNKCLRDTRQD